jgi:hypothetical protein
VWADLEGNCTVKALQEVRPFVSRKPDDTSWERFTRVAEAVSWVWSSSVGKPVWGMQVVLLLWTNGKWKVPLGIRLWRPGGPSKVGLAIGLLRQARRRGLQPAYALCDSWYAAAEIMNLLDGWG